MSRGGLGGWGVSATLVEVIGTPCPTAKSSVGYRGSGAANEGVVHEEGLMAQAHQARYGAGGGALT